MALVQRFGLHTQVAVGNDFVLGVARVDGRLENLYPLPRDGGASQPANQLFALAGKHGTANHFDPAKVAREDIHVSAPARTIHCALESPQGRESAPRSASPGPAGRKARRAPGISSSGPA